MDCFAALAMTPVNDSERTESALERLSNQAEADLVLAIVTANADKLAGNLLVIEPGRARIRPLSR
jgi:hypothetical protein